MLVSVPNVVGTLIVEARALLQGAGLLAGRIATRFATSPVGTVLEQNPKAGEEVLHGTAVDLVTALPRIINPEPDPVPQPVAAVKGRAKGKRRAAPHR